VAVTEPPPLTSGAPSYFADHEKRDDTRFASLETKIEKLTSRQTLILSIVQGLVTVATAIVVALKG
jgi:hypothetical protein